MPDGFAIVSKSASASEIAWHLHDAGCVLAKGILSDDAVQVISDYVYKEVEKHAAVFYRYFGFDWNDTARLADLVSANHDRSAAYDALPPDVQHLVRGELPLSVRISPKLKAIAHEPSLMKGVRAILGDPVVRLHHPPSVRAAQPGMTNSLVPLHQDASYAWHLPDFLTVWVPLCPIDDSCGGIEILPNSHTMPLIQPEPRAIWSELKCQPAQGRLVPIHCEPGDAILFGPRLLHASRPNRSNQIRCSIDYRFFSHRYPTSKRYYDIEAREIRLDAVAQTAAL